jgi:ADP-heptose:LPS heptosyltransferase
MSKQGTIIIYRLGSLGDTVVALPCFHQIARVFPNHERILLTNLPVHAKAAAAQLVIGESGLIDGYITYPVGTRNPLELAKLWWKIRRVRPSAIVYLTPPRGEQTMKRDEKFFRACGVNRIIGIPSGEFAEHRFDPALGLYESESSRMARSLAEIGEVHPENPANWDLLLTGQETSRAAEVLRPLGRAPFLAVGLASKLQATDWGIENWKALMPKLGRHFPGHAAVFIGAKEDHRNIEEVAALWPGQSLNLAGTLTPRESAAVLKLADLYLGLDSGPLHLASSVGTSCVGIFSSRNLPGVWFPFGERNQVVHHPTPCGGCKLDVCVAENKKCILSITPDEVAFAAKQAAMRRPAAARQTIVIKNIYVSDGMRE